MRKQTVPNLCRALDGGGKCVSIQHPTVLLKNGNKITLPQKSTENPCLRVKSDPEFIPATRLGF